MNLQIPWPLVIGSLLLAMGWGCSRDPTNPKIDPFCTSPPASAIVVFEDANLEAAIRDAVWLASQGDLTCGLLETVTTLTANPDLSDIQPLLDNPGLGAEDTVWLEGTNVSCADVDALRAKGVEVISECP